MKTGPLTILPIWSDDNQEVTQTLCRNACLSPIDSRSFALIRGWLQRLSSSGLPRSILHGNDGEDGELKVDWQGITFCGRLYHAHTVRACLQFMVGHVFEGGDSEVGPERL